MEYNPLASKLDELNFAMSQLEMAKEKILREVDWYKNTDLEVLGNEKIGFLSKVKEKNSIVKTTDNEILAVKTKIKEHEARIAELEVVVTSNFNVKNWYNYIGRPGLEKQQKDCFLEVNARCEQALCIDADVSSVETKIRDLEFCVADLKIYIQPIINPKNWFSSEQFYLRKDGRQFRKEICEEKEKVRVLLRKIDALNPQGLIRDEQEKIREEQEALRKKVSIDEERRVGLLENINALKRSILNAEDEIGRHQMFDAEKKASEFDVVQEKIALVEQDQRSILVKKREVDVELQPIVNEIRILELNIEKFRETIRCARELDEKLSSEDNPYERAMLHNQCENEFGEGRPSRVINYNKKEKRQAERDLSKAQQRAEKVGRIAGRIIRTVVVDGNNMCYEGGKFVGLKPVFVVTRELKKQFNTIVVFDAGIRGLIKSSDSKIKNQFSGFVKIHIVATKQKADETILDLACDDNFAYVISNDRFGDYNDKEVVRKGRVIRHEILNGRVFIHDLNVRESF